MFTLFSVLLWAHAADARTVRLCQQLVNESAPEARETLIRPIFSERPEGPFFAAADLLSGQPRLRVAPELEALLAKAAGDLGAGRLLSPVLSTEESAFFAQTGLLPRNFDMGERWFRDPNSALTIGKQSRSIIRRDLGVDVVRDYTWLKSSDGSADLSRVHVARNYRENGTPYSLEMMVFDGVEWQSYLFLAEGNYWKLTDKIDGKSVREVCMKCHISKGNGRIPSGHMSPNPFFMTEARSWFRSGFADSDLVDRLLKY